MRIGIEEDRHMEQTTATAVEQEMAEQISILGDAMLEICRLQNLPIPPEFQIDWSADDGNDYHIRVEVITTQES
jgi:hypothetical protein